MGRLWRDAVVDLPVIIQRTSFQLLSLPMGLWMYDAMADRCLWEPLTYDLHGIRPGEPVSFDTWANSVHAPERDRAIRACREHFERDAVMEFTYCTECGRRIALRGQIRRSDDGKLVSAYGAVLDIGSIETMLARAHSAAVEVADMLGADDLDPDRSQWLVREIRDTLGGMAVR